MDIFSFAVLILFAINLSFSSYLFSEKRKSCIDTSFMIISVTLIVMGFQYFCLMTIKNELAFRIVLKTFSVTYVIVHFVFLHFFIILLDRKRDILYKFLFIAMIISVFLAIFFRYPFSGYSIKPDNFVIYIYKHSRIGFILSSFLPMFYSMILLLKKYRKMKIGPLKRGFLFLLIGFLFTFLIGAFLYGAVTKHIIGVQKSIKRGFSIDKYNGVIRSIVLTLQVLLIFIFGKRYKFLSIGINDVSKNLFEDIDHGVIIVSSEGEIENVNARALRLLELNREELVNKPVKKIIPDYDKLNMLEENEIEFSNDKIFSIYPSKIEYKTLEIGTVLMIRDISNEKAMRKDLNLKSRVFDNMTEAVLVISRNKKIIQCNKAAEIMFEHEKSEMIGKSPPQIFSANSKIDDNFFRKITEIVGQGKEWRGEIDYTTKAGEERVRDVIAVPVFEDNEIKEVISINRDITERKKYEREREKLLAQLETANDELERSNHELEQTNDELERANVELEAANEEMERTNVELETANHELKKLSDMKDEFLSVASHDLRSPFNGILGFSEILLNEKNLDNYHKELVGYIKISAETQLAYVNDILDIIRFESGKIKLQYEAINLSELIRTSLHSLSILADKKQIMILPEISTDQTVNIDSAKIVQVINNFISNAIKFTPSGGTIQIKLYENKEGGFEIHVIDNGMGIPKDMQDKLFSRYEQVHTQGTEGEAGTGLGLSICKQLIHAHGGEIGVESEPGKGSDFYFTLPASLKT